MLPPVRCMHCGKLLANKWDYYQRRLRELKGSAYAEPTYFMGKAIPETPEAKVMKELDLERYCCRMVLMTHVNLR